MGEFMCAHTWPTKSWRRKPAVPVLPNKDAIVGGGNWSFAPGANAHVHVRMEERTAPDLKSFRKTFHSCSRKGERFFEGGDTDTDVSFTENP